jgi:hypothetical protein
MFLPLGETLARQLYHLYHLYSSVFPSVILSVCSALLCLFLALCLKF